jgi:hypothetical protein
LVLFLKRTNLIHKQQTLSCLKKPAARNSIDGLYSSFSRKRSKKHKFLVETLANPTLAENGLAPKSIGFEWAGVSFQ